MKAVTIKIPDAMYVKLARSARDNGRRLPRELACLIFQSMRNAAMARRAKIAVLGATFSDAREFALARGWKRYEWFYAHSVESVLGRLVRRVEVTARYRRRNNHEEIMRHLERGMLAVRNIIADAVAHGQ